MTIDNYQLCPCGSGKKIKFCKCKDSVGELDRVIKMIEGGQLVAALDRLNQILKEHPSAAWALSIRGRLLMDLKEHDALVDNAERFVRLQPSNPLALAQKAVVSLMEANTAEATEALLQVLDEAGDRIDPFILEVMSGVMMQQWQRDWVSTALAYGNLLVAAGSQNTREAQLSLRELRRILSSPEINLLLKETPELRERPDSVEWGERFDEAAGLLLNYRVLSAEPKLESLARQYPDQPAILFGLVMCAIWRGDVSKQAELLGKLAECEELDLEERARMLASAGLVDPKQKSVAAAMTVRVYEIEDAQEAIAKLDPLPRMRAIPANQLENVGSDGIKPRGGFRWLSSDPDQPDKDATISPVTILVYGRQTDRAARLEVQSHDADFGGAEAELDRLLPERKRIEERQESIPVLYAFMLSHVDDPGRSLDDAGRTEELRRYEATFWDVLKTMRVPLFDNVPLEQVAVDDTTLLERTAFVRLLQGYDLFRNATPDALEELQNRWSVEPLPQLAFEEVDPTTLGVFDLDCVQVEQAEADDYATLYELLQQAVLNGHHAAMTKIAGRMVELEPAADMAPAKVDAYQRLAGSMRTIAESLKCLEAGVEYARAHDIDPVELLLQMLPLKLAGGDPGAFQEQLTGMLETYRDNQEVLYVIQQMLMQMGLIGPDGQPMGPPSGQPAAAEAAGGESSGLWVPGQENAPSQGGSEGSKLWLPGSE